MLGKTSGSRLRDRNATAPPCTNARQRTPSSLRSSIQSSLSSRSSLSVASIGSIHSGLSMPGTLRRESDLVARDRLVGEQLFERCDLTGLGGSGERGQQAPALAAAHRQATLA